MIKQSTELIALKKREAALSTEATQYKAAAKAGKGKHYIDWAVEAAGELARVRHQIKQLEGQTDDPVTTKTTSRPKAASTELRDQYVAHRNDW